MEDVTKLSPEMLTSIAMVKVALTSFYTYEAENLEPPALLKEASELLHKALDKYTVEMHIAADVLIDEAIKLRLGLSSEGLDEAIKAANMLCLLS